MARVYLSFTGDAAIKGYSSAFDAVRAEGHVIVNRWGGPVLTSAVAMPLEKRGEAIDACDVFLSIVGRYRGNPLPGGEALVEWEYRRAREAGRACVAVFGYFQAESWTDVVGHLGTALVGKTYKLAGFREQVKRDCPTAEFVFDKPGDLERALAAVFAALRTPAPPAPAPAPAPSAERSQSSSGLEVFFSYSHADEQYLKELKKHMAILRRRGIVREWHDEEIHAGSDWMTEILSHLDSAPVIVLLISADFVNSDFCHGIELARALERHDRRTALVVPVLLRNVARWREEPFAKLKVLPKDGLPVDAWPRADDAYVNVVEGLYRRIESRFLVSR